MSDGRRLDVRTLSVDPDITVARTLPGRFYADRAVHEALIEAVFARSWQYVGDISENVLREHARPIDWLPGSCNEPLALVTDGSGTTRCLSNVCTHRANLVVTSAGSCTSLRCSYHGRRFALDGSFRSMPEFESARDFPSPADDLRSLPLARLDPVLFAAIDPIDSFEAVCDGWLARIASLPRDRAVLVESDSRSYEVNANWALYCENYLEGFHVPFVHAKTLGPVLDYGAYETELFDASVLQTGIAPPGETAFEDTETGRLIAAYYVFLFPNTMLNFYPWGLSLNVVQPLAVDRTRIVYRTYVWDPSLRGRGAGGDLDAVEHEDDAIVERVQRGVRSRLYDRGRFSPARERGVHWFQRKLASAIMKG